MSWFPKPDESLDVRWRRFYRTARRVFFLFSIVGAIGAAQTYSALRSGEQWKNSTGQFMTPTEMIQQTWAFAIASVLGVVLCVLLHRAGKKARLLALRVCLSDVQIDESCADGRDRTRCVDAVAVWKALHGGSWGAGLSRSAARVRARQRISALRAKAEINGIVRVTPDTLVRTMLTSLIGKHPMRR